MAGRTFCGYNACSATKEIAIHRPNHRLLVLAGILTAACSSPEPPPPPAYAPREVVTLGEWDVHSAGAVIGRVVKLEIRDPSGPVRMFRVEDRAGRWLGFATEYGRFTRRVMDRDEDLGVLAMPRGVALLFEASQPVELKAVPVEADLKR